MLIYIAMSAVLLLGIAVFALARSERRLAIPAGTFGGRSDNLHEEERRLLVKAYVSQQRWSFGLVFAAIASGLVIAVALLVRALTQAALDLSIVAGASGIAADVWLGRRAWQLYQAASKRVEKVANAS